MSQDAFWIRCLLVPLDGTSESLVALSVAEGLAQKLGATIHAVHIGSPHVPPRELSQKLGIPELHAIVVEHECGATSECAEIILEREQRYEGTLIVLCSHTTRAARGHLGTIARKILLSARGPVLLVDPERGGVPWRLERILLPHDGSPDTASALSPALELAKRAAAELLVLHVADSGKRPEQPGTFTVPCYLDQPQHEWPAWSSEFLCRLQALGGMGSGLRLRLSLATGAAGEEIARVAREEHCDLIVMAWHGGLESERALTLKAVLRESDCPVLLLRK